MKLSNFLLNVIIVPAVVIPSSFAGATESTTSMVFLSQARAQRENTKSDVINMIDGHVLTNLAPVNVIGGSVNKDSKAADNSEGPTEDCTKMLHELEIPDNVISKKCSDKYILKVFDKDSRSYEKDDFKYCIKNLKEYYKDKPDYFETCANDFDRSNFKTKAFPLCMKNLGQMGYDASSSLRRCNQFDQQQLADSDFPKCTSSLYSWGFSTKTAFSKCMSQKNRDKYLSKDFGACRDTVASLPNIYLPLTLSFCENDVLSKNISEDDYKTCTASQDIKDVNVRAALCAIDDYSKNSGKKSFVSCVNQGLESYQKNSFFFALNDYLRENHTSSFFSTSGKPTTINFILDDCSKGKARSTKPSPNRYLSLLKDYNMHTGLKFESPGSEPLTIGGVSAFAFDAAKGELLGLSDVGPGQYVGQDVASRIYVFKLNKDFELSEKEIKLLQDNKHLIPNMDPEGLALAANGYLIVSSEGQFEYKPNQKDPAKDSATGQALGSSTNDSGNEDKSKDGSSLDQSAQNDHDKSDSLTKTKHEKNQDDPMKKPNYLNIFKMDGNFVSTVELPEDFRLKFEEPKKEKKSFWGNSKYSSDEKKPITGLRGNKGLEGLTLSPSGKMMFISNEQSLFQDTEDCSSSGKSNSNREMASDSSYEDRSACVRSVRIVSFNKISDENYRYADQYHYRLEPEVDNGISELLALDEQNILVLERSWNEQKGKLTARIFRVTLDPMSRIPSGTKLPETKIPPLKKTLIADLDSFLDYMSPGFKKLDNFEAMAFGPPSPRGLPTLILGTDNNFSQRQRTVFLIFEIIGDLKH